MSHDLEFRRQLAHVVFGVLVLWGIHFKVLTVPVLFVTTLILFFTLWAIKKGIYRGLFYKVLHLFEREKHLERWPGRGLFFYLLATLILVLLFEETIVMASLSILLIGDAVTNVAGRHLGKIPNPLNKEKTVEGTLAGILSSFIVCLLFFPIIPSIITSIVAMIIEVPKLSIYDFPIDDNLTIPLSAASVLFLFSL